MTIPELKELNEQIPSMDCTALQCALRETVSQLTEMARLSLKAVKEVQALAAATTVPAARLRSTAAR